MPKFLGGRDKIDYPTFQDLRDNNDLEQILQREIADVWEETDEYLLLGFGGRLPDPEEILVRLERIKKRARPLPKPEQESLSRRILEAEDRVVRYSVFYWRQTIIRFGFRNRKQEDLETLREVGDELKQEILTFLKRIDAKKFPEVIEDLNDLLPKIDRYASEPRAYEFDELSDELRKIIQEKIISNFQFEHHRGLSDSRHGQQENLKFLERLKEKLVELENLVSEMIDEKIKAESSREVEFLKNMFERAEFEESSIEVLAGYRATVENLRYRLTKKEDISQETSDLRQAIERTLGRAKEVGSIFVSLLTDLLSNISRIERRQNPLPEEDWLGCFREAERKRDLGLAYAVLGIFEEEPTRETVRARRNELAKKYHSDMGEGDDTKIKQVNAAYELIKRARGW
jgi:hypothetical protein